LRQAKLAEKIFNYALDGEAWAAQMVLDRIEGKVPQPVAHAHETKNDISQFSEAELTQMLRERMANMQASALSPFRTSVAGQAGSPIASSLGDGWHTQAHSSLSAHIGTRLAPETRLETGALMRCPFLMACQTPWRIHWRAFCAGRCLTSAEGRKCMDEFGKADKRHPKKDHACRDKRGLRHEDHPICR
jgi:hypothetical protein